MRARGETAIDAPIAEPCEGSSRSVERDKLLEEALKLVRGLSRLPLKEDANRQRLVREVFGESDES